jgi:hypothetical protein
MNFLKFLSNSHISTYNKDSYTLNVLDVAIPTSTVTASRVVKLRVEQDQSRSTSYLVRAISGKFNLHSGNMNFRTLSEGVK